MIILKSFITLVASSLILFVRVIKNAPPFVHETYFLRLHCISKVVYSFAQDDLERSDWSRYLKCYLNFKINRLKQNDCRQICPYHFVNCWLRNFKRQMKIIGKILKNYIWTYQNGLHRERSDSEREKLNDPKDICLYQPSVSKIYFSISPYILNPFFSLSVLAFICVNQKPIINYSG